MVDNLNVFANWLFDTLTAVWNFCVSNALIKWFVAILILDFLVNHLKKYAGKG